MKMEPMSIFLVGEDGAWTFLVKTAQTRRGGAFKIEAEDQLYAWYTALPKLPIMLTTDEGVPLDQVKSLEEQGISDGARLHIHFPGSRNTLAAKRRAHDTAARPADDASASTPREAKGGACLVV